MRKSLGFVFVFALLSPGATSALSDPPWGVDSEFVFARIRFNMGFRAAFNGELPWHHDYPFAEHTFLGFLGVATGVRSTTES
jgi:hypothetical protein